MSLAEPGTPAVIPLARRQRAASYLTAGTSHAFGTMPDGYLPRNNCDERGTFSARSIAERFELREAFGRLSIRVLDTNNYFNIPCAGLPSDIADAIPTGRILIREARKGPFTLRIRAKGRRTRIQLSPTRAIPASIDINYAYRFRPVRGCVLLPGGEGEGGCPPQRNAR